MKHFFTFCIVAILILSFLTLCSCNVNENDSSDFNKENKESIETTNKNGWNESELNKEDKGSIETSWSDGWNVNEYINSIENLMLAIRVWDAFCELDYIDLDRIGFVKTNLELLVKYPFPYIENYSDFYIKFDCGSGCVTVRFTTADGTDYSFIYLFNKDQAYVESNNKFGELKIGNQQIEMFSLTNHNSSWLVNVKKGIWENSGFDVLIIADGNNLENPERFPHFYTVDLIEMASEYDFSN